MSSCKIYIIPPNTEFFSIALQEMITCKRQLFVKATNKVDGNWAFGTLQLKFDNHLLQSYIGKDAISYVDKANGDISMDFKNLKRV